MSDLASKLKDAPATGERVRRGPANMCMGIYQPDIEDWDAIDNFRHRPGESWATAQKRWDGLLGRAYPAIPNDKFRYHWNRRCWCWPDDLRRA